jgi:hypothetical protein
LASCLPSFDDRPWLVDEARILAVRGTPAEERPNLPVAFEALVATPSGTATPLIEWAYCTKPRAIDERTGITASCLAGSDLVDIDASTTILADGCARFGPNPPPTDEQDGARRPADPDPTGGYYVPVRARLVADSQEVIAFGLQRVRCDLAGATRAIFDEFEDRYTLNLAPDIAGATLRDEGRESDVATGAATVAAGATVELRMTPAADAAEPYVVYSPEDAALFTRTESLTASWYVTAGELDRAHQTLTGDALSSGAVFTNQWHAPTTATTAHGWIVLRDTRGGVAWLPFTVQVP